MYHVGNDQGRVDQRRQVVELAAAWVATDVRYLPWVAQESHVEEHGDVTSGGRIRPRASRPRRSQASVAVAKPVPDDRRHTEKLARYPSGGSTVTAGDVRC